MTQKIKVISRRFIIDLDEREVCDLVQALKKYNVHPNCSHELKADLIEALGFIPEDDL